VLAGVVVERADLDGSPRVRVALPWLASEPVETAWAPVATPGAGAQRGAYLVPDVGDEVVVAFDRGDFDHPIVVGGLWNAQDRSPEDGADGQVRTQSITSRSGHVIRFEDDEGEEQVVVQSGAGPITIQADGDVNVVSVEGAIRVEGNDLELRAAGDLHVGADGDVTIEAGGSMYLKSGADTVVHADHDLSISSAADLRLDADLRLNAKAALEAKIDGGTKATLRAATTDVHGDASTTIKGGVVMIN
jgi:phage baseplate assembly protein V